MDTVRAEGDVVDEAFVATQRSVAFHQGHIPQPHGVVAGGRRQPAAIWAIGARPDIAGMALEHGDQVAIGRVPQPHGAVQRSGYEARSIRAEDGLNDVTRVPL